MILAPRRVDRALLAILSLITLLTACSAVPIADQPQSLLLDNAQLGGLDRVAQVIINGARADGTLMSKSDPDHPARTLERVSRVARRMLAASNIYSSQVYVIRRPTANAFITPSGMTIVYSGLLDVAESDAMLGFVIGHQIGHLKAHHAAERQGQRHLADMALGMAVASPFIREHESEANRIGMILMAKAGYDPNEAVRLWERMATYRGPRPPEFLATHPNPDIQGQEFKQQLAGAMPYFRRDRAARSERFQPVALVLIPVLPSSKLWWDELSAIMDTRAQGMITDDQAARLKERLMKRTVDLSYPGLRGLSIEGDPEFWDKILRLQAARTAGTISVWDAEIKVQELVGQKQGSRASR
jgi:metalloendopeptidase OMA1, mitochondrial